MQSFSFPTRPASDMSIFSSQLDQQYRFFLCVIWGIKSGLMDVRTTYKSLQEQASAHLSKAVSESSKLFAEVKHGRDTFRTSIAKNLDISDRIKPNLSESSSNYRYKEMNTTRAVALLDDSDDPFISLIAELLKGRTEPNPVFPSPGGRSSPSVISSGSRTPVSVRAKTTPPSATAKGFGSSQPRFSYGHKINGFGG
jgi:hypothetical protein